MNERSIDELKERLYSALKHEKSCTCGHCFGGLHAVDELVARAVRAEAALREIVDVCIPRSYRFKPGDDLNELVVLPLRDVKNIALDALAGQEGKPE